MKCKWVVLSLGLVVGGCRSGRAPATAAVVTGVQPIAGGRVAAPPLQVTREVNPADVNFMAGMIPHHAQAVLIAGWAASHGASSELQALCERIVVAQRDEIELMRNWLRDRGQPVPPPDAKRHRMVMHGTEHEMLMPGMLTDEELARLDSARGVHFDELFLEYMIKHHEGALRMSRNCSRLTELPRTRLFFAWRRTSTPTRRLRSRECRRCWRQCALARRAASRQCD